MVLVIIVLIVVLYFALAGGRAGSGSTSSFATTAGGASHPSISSSLATTVFPITTTYTTIAPQGSSTNTPEIGFLYFVPSNVVNSSLGGAYHAEGIYIQTLTAGMLKTHTQIYTSKSSNVSITLSQYNTSAFAYENYNRTYNEFYSFSKEYGKLFYSSTNDGAAYLITNDTVWIPENVIVNYYYSEALYSGYILNINITKADGTLSQAQVQSLTLNEIKGISGSAS